MLEPIETIGGLNPFQIEIEDDRVLNMLKKYTNIIYRLTPLGMLFSSINKKRQRTNIYSMQRIK